MLVSSINQSAPGQSITLTATVSSSQGTPTGMVTFYDGNTGLGTQVLTSGIAALSTSSLSAGTHSLTASYDGAANFAGSISPVLNQVVQAGQNIAFGALSNQVYGTAPFIVTATASSGLPVSFASTTSAVRTVAGAALRATPQPPLTSLSQSHSLRTMYLLLRITSIALATSSILSAAAANDVLHTFQGTTDGLFPEYPLITDTHGNLFGVTILGGSRGQGTVFELSPNNGGYSYRQLYAFQGYPGASTPTGPLVMDSAGNLYGTAGGGPYSSFPYGTIFELSPTAGGDWSEKVIYNFPPVSYAPSQPTGGLVIDANGNLYGVSQKGGTRYSGGTVFELSPNENGVWAIKVLYKFNGSYNAGGDGYDPIGGLTFDTAGNLYGTTYYGGTDQQGVVFQLSPQTDGTWAETVLHSFIGRDGCNPASAVVLDKSGNVYGTTSVLSEAYTTTCESQGTVFELSPSETGWKETVLYLFRNGTHEGQYPNGVILDNNGNLYGTTLLAGLYGYGVIFELTPQPTGMGTLKIIYNFTGGADGGTPKGGVIFGIDGNLYGTTNSYGGTDGSGRGTVFRQNP